MPEDRPPGLSGQTGVPAVEDQRTTGGKPVCPDRRDAYLPGIEAETSLIVRELTRKPEGSIERFSSRSPETLARFRHSSQGRDPDGHAASPHAAFSTPVEMTGESDKANWSMIIEFI